MAKLLKKEGISTFPVGELGNTLPIGIFKDGGRNRSFRLGELDFPTEKALGDWKKGPGQGKPVGAVVTKLLALLLRELGGEPFEHNFDDPPDVEAAKLLKIQQMYSSDVYYMYVRARIEELGSEYALPFVCQNNSCKYTAEEMVCDLNEMDVYCVEDPSVLVQKVPLIKGIRHHDNTIRMGAVLTPLLWMHMESQDLVGQNDELLVKLYFISKCLTGLEGENNKDGTPMSLVIPKSSLNSLRKMDIELLDRAINKVNLGPSLVASGECPECNRGFYHQIDWNYNHFFGASSLPTPGKTSSN
jgi:hypothetical protein